jgi:hypothetical protein
MSSNFALFFYILSTAVALQGSSWQHVRFWLLGLLFETIIVQLIAFPIHKHPIREALYFGDGCLQDVMMALLLLQVEWNRCYFGFFIRHPLILKIEIQGFNAGSRALSSNNLLANNMRIIVDYVMQVRTPNNI